MARVLAKVLGSVNHVALAAEIVNSVGNALRIDALLGAGAEVFGFFEAGTIFDAVFEHHAGLLAQRGVFLLVWLGVLFPPVLDKAHL